MKKVVLVTGAAAGIGAACAEYFEKCGWLPLRADLSPMTGAGSFQVDLSVESEVVALFQEIEKNHGRLDSLINNAAIQIEKSVESTTAAEWDSVFASNVRSAFLCSRQAIPLLRNSRGSIVNVGSVHGTATSPGLLAYVASKGAMAAMSRALALELAPDIRVNCVAPGATRTEMLMKGLGRWSGSTEEATLDLAQKHPLGRIGEPAEIASAIEFLANEERASFITGQTLIVDGGATARLSTE